MSEHLSWNTHEHLYLKLCDLNTLPKHFFFSVKILSIPSRKFTVFSFTWNINTVLSLSTNSCKMTSFPKFYFVYSELAEMINMHFHFHFNFKLMYVCVTCPLHSCYYQNLLYMNLFYF